MKQVLIFVQYFKSWNSDGQKSKAKIPFTMSNKAKKCTDIFTVKELHKRIKNVKYDESGNDTMVWFNQ